MFQRLMAVMGLTLLMGLGACPMAWAANTIDFERFTDQANTPVIDDATVLTDQFSGLTFQGAIVLKAQFSLLETEYPPHSGDNAVVDDGSPITITFASPQSSVSGFITYSHQVTILGLEVGGTSQMWTSSTSDNTVGSGSSTKPNEEFLLQSATAGFYSIQIIGADAGYSYAFDDLSFAALVPEPGALALWLSGLMLMVVRLPAVRRRMALMAGLAVLAPCSAFAADPPLGLLTVSPSAIPFNTSTLVTVKVINNSADPATLLVQQVEPDGGFAVLKSLGYMKPTGVANEYSLTFDPKLASANASKPMHVRVSYGLASKPPSPKRLSCRSVPINFTDGPVSAVNITEVEKLANSVKTAGQFLDRLPAEYKQHWIFMTRTESAQKASATHPRVIVPSRDAKNVFAFETDDGSGQRHPQIIEYLTFDDTTNDFAFYEIDLDPKPPKPATPKIRKDPGCSACHEGRPNWDAYDSWAGMLPFTRDRLYEKSLELTAFKGILKNLVKEPVVSRLELPKNFTTTCDAEIGVASFTGTKDLPVPANKTNVPYSFPNASPVPAFPGDKSQPITQGGAYIVVHHSQTDAGGDPDEGRGVKLFDNLSAFNAKRIAQQLKSGKFKVDVRPVALAIAGCAAADLTDLSKFAPVKDVLPALFKANGTVLNANPTAADLDQALAALIGDTQKRRQTLATIRANLQAINLVGEAGNIGVIAAAGGVAGIESVAQEIFRRTGRNAPAANFNVDQSIKLALDREIYNDTAEDLKIALYRLFLQPAGVAVDSWSMSVTERSTTYTFGDVFGPVGNVYLGQIRQVLGNEADLTGKSCAQLQALSLAAYGAFTP